ncbi:unnamed protein product, partial [Urochloa humidicola]
RHWKRLTRLIENYIEVCSNTCKAAAAILLHSANHQNLTTKAISFLIYFSIRLDKEQADVCWEQNTMSNTQLV